MNNILGTIPVTYSNNNSVKNALNFINGLLIGTTFLFLVFVPSIVMDDLMYPTQTGKFFFFAYFLVSYACIWIIKSVFFHQVVTIKINILDVLLLVLLIYMVINRYVIQDTYGFSLKFYELLGLSIFYIIVRVTPKEKYFIFLLAIVLSGTIQAIYGALQLWGYYASHHSGFKMTGSFFNPGPYAGFLAAVFPLALGMYLFRQTFHLDFAINRGFKIPWVSYIDDKTVNSLLNKVCFEYIPLIGIFSILLVLPASQSRAAWLAVIGGSAILGAIRFNIIKTTIYKINTIWKKVLVGFALAFSLTTVVFGLYHFKKDSADGRLLIWKVTSDIILDNPWFGVGFDRFKAHYMSYQADYFREVGENGEEMVAGDNFYAFSELLGFVSEQGMIGFIILIAIGSLIFNRIFVKKSVHKTMVPCISIFSILIFSSFSYPGEILPVTICLVGYMAILSGEFFKSHELRRRNVLLSGFSFSVVGLVLIFMISPYLAKLNRAFSTWNEAYQEYNFQFYEESLGFYLDIEPVFHNNGEYLMNYGKALSMAGKYTQAIEVLNKANKYYGCSVIQTALGGSHQSLGEFMMAEQAYWQAWYMIPGRFYPKYLLAKMYEESGDTQSAVKIANELLQKEVKVNSIAIKQIRNEMKKIITSVGEKRHSS